MWQIWCISFPVFSWLTQIFWKVEWEQCSMFSDPSNHSLGVVECTQGYEFHFHQVMMMMMIVAMMGIFTPTRLIGLYECASIATAAIGTENIWQEYVWAPKQFGCRKIMMIIIRRWGKPLEKNYQNRDSIPNNRTPLSFETAKLSFLAHSWFFPVENWVVLLLL